MKEEWWYETTFKNQVDRRIAKLSGWHLVNDIWFDGERDTNFTLHKPPSEELLWYSYEKFTPTEDLTQAVDAAARISDRRGADFLLSRSKPYWHARFDVHGSGLEATNIDEPRVICEAIIRFENWLRGQPRGKRKSHRRGRGGRNRRAAASPPRG